MPEEKKDTEETRIEGGSFEINPSAVYNVRDVAPKLGLDYWHLTDASQRGLLSTRAVGKHVLVLGSALLTFLDGGSLKRRVQGPRVKADGTTETSAEGEAVSEGEFENSDAAESAPEAVSVRSGRGSRNGATEAPTTQSEPVAVPA